MVKEFLSVLFPVICAVLALFFLILTINNYMLLPTVYTSNTTGECVKVEFADGTITDCSCLKDIPRYNAIWVK